MQLLTIVINLGSWSYYVGLFFFYLYMAYRWRQSRVLTFRVWILKLTIVSRLEELRNNFRLTLPIAPADMHEAFSTGDFSKVHEKIKDELEKKSALKIEDEAEPPYQKLPSDNKMIFSFKRLRIENYFDDADCLKLMCVDLAQTMLCPKCKDKKNMAHLCEPKDEVTAIAPYIMSCPAYDCPLCNHNFTTRYTRKIGELTIKTKAEMEVTER